MIDVRRATVGFVKVVPSRVEDRPVLEAFLQGHNALLVTRAGELVSAADHPALLAWADEELVGVATYVIDQDCCELLTLHARERLQGVGSALVSALRGLARNAGCTHLSVTTTNDNVDALRFYQRRGFHLVRLRAGAVDESRVSLKPEIPEVGDHGIALRDELELEADLSAPARLARSSSA